MQVQKNVPVRVGNFDDIKVIESKERRVVETALVDGKLYKRHTNSDGRFGGFVADTARVDTYSYVSRDSIVKDDARVIDSSLTNGSVVKDTSEVITSRIDNSAICNGSIIIDSKILESHISGSVIESSDWKPLMSVNAYWKNDKFTGYVEKGSGGEIYFKETLWSDLRRLEQ